MRDILAEMYGEELLFADGFDDAIIGVGERNSDTFVVYDLKKVFAILESEGMSSDEAREHFEFNILGAYVGEHTPAFVTLV